MRSAATAARRRGGARCMEVSLRAPSAARAAPRPVGALLRKLRKNCQRASHSIHLYAWAEKGGVRMVERRERHNCCASTNSHHTHSANRHLGGGSRFGFRFVRFSPPSATALGAQVPAALSPPQGLAVHAALVEPRRGPGARWTTSSRSASSSTSSTSRGTWRRSTACSAGRSVRFRVPARAQG